MQPRDYLEWAVLQFVIAMLLVMLVALAQVVIGMIRGQIKPYRAFDDDKGVFAWSRFWTQVVKSLLCYAMVKDISNGQPSLELLGMCSILIGGHEMLALWVAIRGGKVKDDEDPAPGVAPAAAAAPAATS